MTPRTRKLPTYTLAELNTLLQLECLSGISALPAIDNYTFTRTPAKLADGDTGTEKPDRLCDAHLLLGKGSDESTAHKSVHLCLESNSNGKFFLSCNNTLYIFNFENLSYVDLDPPFRKLLESDEEVEVLHNYQMLMLKAYGYYLFLSAGHISNIQLYHGFENSLILACKSFAKRNRDTREIMIPQQDSKRQREPAAKSKIVILKFSQGLRATSTATSVRDSSSPEEQEGESRSRKGTTSDDTDEEEEEEDKDTPQYVPDDHSLDDNLKWLLNLLEITDARLLALESSCKAVQLKADSVEGLKDTIEQQLEEIKELKQKLKEKDVKIMTMNLELESLKLHRAAGKETADVEQRPVKKARQTPVTVIGALPKPAKRATPKPAEKAIQKPT